MDKISVIIPAYNAEKTVERCILSVLNQTYSNLEIIIIDDGSTDNTLRIINQLCSKDSRINVFSVENRGVSNARNIGLDKSTGDYIAFVDADDYIDTDMYKTLHEIAVSNDADVSHCGYKNIVNNNAKGFSGNNDGDVFTHTGEEVIDLMLTGTMISTGIWNKLYKKELFDDIRFDERIKFNEDLLINFYVFRKVGKSVYIDRAFYNYVTTETSATHSTQGYSSNEDVYRVAGIIEEQSKGLKCYNSALKRKSYMALDLYRAYLFSDDKDIDSKKKRLLTEIKVFHKRKLYDTKNAKISVFLFQNFPFVYKCVYKIYDRIRIKQLDPH
ncbi:MAG: glycosyltransferase family 2 protein [Lachnospira sp.]